MRKPDARIATLNNHMMGFVDQHFNEEARNNNLSVSVMRTDLPNMFNVRVRANSREILSTIDAEVERKAKEIDPAIRLNFC